MMVFALLLPLLLPEVKGSADGRPAVPPGLIFVRMASLSLLSPLTDHNPQLVK